MSILQATSARANGVPYLVDHLLMNLQNKKLAISLRGCGRCSGWTGVDSAVGKSKLKLHRLSASRAQIISSSEPCNDKTSIIVIGAGVIGLTSALRLAEAYPNASIEIVAEKVALDTTSEGAGGLWKPFALTGTPNEL